MNPLLSSTRNVVAPEPRPMVVAPSLAARQPVADAKPTPPRNHQFDERPGRAGAQRGLRHVEREIRHAVKAEVKAADLDLETMGSIRVLQQDFRRELHGVFQQAGNRGGLDRSQVLEGMAKALQDLAAGLRDLNDANDLGVTEGGTEQTLPVVDGPVDELPVNVAGPGTLVDFTG